MTLSHRGAALIGYVLLQLAQRDPGASDVSELSETDKGFFREFLDRADMVKIDTSSVRRLYSEDAAAVDDVFARFLNATEPSSYGLRPDNEWLWAAGVWLEAITGAKAEDPVVLF